MAALRKRAPRQKIAARLRRFRIAAGLTQEECADAFRITRGQWTRIEGGLQSIPSERLIDFAVLLKTTAPKLLGIRPNELELVHNENDRAAA